MARISLDIFCRVIDNYGDAGVCLHLARSLSTMELPQDQHFLVRLFCDDLKVLNTIADAADHDNPQLEICSWEQPLTSYEPGDVVISAFSCRFDELTLKTLQARQQSTNQPLIINLEYLSAESWVEDCHTLPSPADGLISHFFFPGFTARTGGLNLDQHFLSQCKAQLEKPGHAGWSLSLFGYHNPAILRLLQALAASGEPCELKVFSGLALDNLNELLSSDLKVGQTLEFSPKVRCSAVPMTDHSGYDQVLLNCDFNLVRGEDSIVRAMHTGHPFLWQIYPQDENAHIVKLNAFLDCMERTLKVQEPSLSDLKGRMELLRRTMLSYNEALPQGEVDPFGAPDFLAHFSAYCGPLFIAWARYLCQQPTLTERLSSFILSKL